MSKEKKKKPIEKKKKVNSAEDKKIMEIIKEYPKRLSCYPREVFEEQLKKFIKQYFEIKK